MTEIIGFIGSVAFAISGIPAACAAYKDRSCTYPWAFLGLWGLGESLCSIYVLSKGADTLFWYNYLPNAICLIVLMRYNNAIPRKEV